MVVDSDMIDSRRGSIGIAILICVLLFAAGGHSISYMAREAIEHDLNRLLQKQMQSISFAITKAALAEEREGDLQACVLPDFVLYPGKHNVRSAVEIFENKELGIKTIKCIVDVNNAQLKLKTQKLDMAILFGELPASCAIWAAGEVVGKEFLVNPDSCSDASVMLAEKLQPITVDKYEQYTERSFPSVTELTENGFANALYYDGSNNGKLISSSAKGIKGNAVLVAAQTIELAENMEFLNRIVVVSNGRIVVGRNVKLLNALLIAKAGVKIESGASLSGLVLSGSNVIVEPGVVITRNVAALAPFYTLTSIEQ